MPEAESKHGAGLPLGQLGKSVGQLVVKSGRVAKVLWGRAGKRLKMVTAFTGVM